MTAAFIESVCPSDNCVRSATLRRIVDGDTIVVDVDLLFKTSRDVWIRFAGLDTPEVRGPEREAGKFVERQLESIMTEKLTLHSVSLDRYDRSIATVWNSDGLNVNNWLLDSNLAWKTDKDGKVVGPRDLNRLTLPDAILRKHRENVT